MLIYTTGANIFERPDGVKIASFFIAAIILTSLTSRATRSTELRVTGVEVDKLAEQFLREYPGPDIRIIANEPDTRDEIEYREKEREERADHHIPADDQVLFLEVTVPDSSEFEDTLRVIGEERFGYRILRVEAPAVPNAIAAVLLHIRETTGKLPHVYFAWMEANPIRQLLGYILTGQGDVPHSPAKSFTKPSPTHPNAPSSMSADYTTCW